LTQAAVILFFPFILGFVNKKLGAKKLLFRRLA